jgi:hypothetical protein
MVSRSSVESQASLSIWKAALNPKNAAYCQGPCSIVGTPFPFLSRRPSILSTLLER